MLDPAQPIDLPELPGVRVWGDSRDPATFYALPARPRLAVGTDGSPELRLTLFGRRSEGRFEVEGALVAATVELVLGADELGRVGRALARRGGGAPRLAPAVWSSGTVEVTLAPGVVLEGRPSLYGDNRCALQTRLPADAARRLEKAWDDGLPGAEAVYRLTAPGTPGAVRLAWHSRTASRSAAGPGGSVTGSATAGVSASGERRAGGEPAEIRLAGPLAPPAGPGPVSRITM